MSKVKGLKEAVFKVSDGLVGTMADFLLFQFYLSGELFGAISNRDITDTFDRAKKSLDGFNYQKFKSVISYLLKDDLITKKNLNNKKKKKEIELKITKEGRNRLKEIIPSYKKERIWDGKIYLITYDIPEKKRTKRDLLRSYLKRIGCGLLQESVWLTFYNPKEVLRDFINENNLNGLILVSSLEKDSSIGDEDLKNLVKRVYKLEELNKNYSFFIKKFRDRWPIDKVTLSFSYYQVLRRDPQLPFELLPDNWLGNQANQLFNKLIKAD